MEFHGHEHEGHDEATCPLAQVSKITAGILDESTPMEWLRNACTLLAEKLAELPDEELSLVGSKLFHPTLAGADDPKHLLGTVQSLVVTEVGIRTALEASE